MKNIKKWLNKVSLSKVNPKIENKMKDKQNLSVRTQLQDSFYSSIGVKGSKWRVNL